MHIKEESLSSGVILHVQYIVAMKHYVAIPNFFTPKLSASFKTVIARPVDII